MHDGAAPPPRGKRGGRAPRSPPAIDLSTPSRSPGRLLHDAHVRLRAGLVRVLAEAGHPLSAEEWSVLTSLWGEDGLTQLEIGERVGKDRHHTSRLVDALEQQGLVSRAAADGDRRAKRVSLTAEGLAARPVLMGAVGGLLAEVFEGVSQADYDAFLRCLEHVVRQGPRPESSGESQ